MDFWKTHKVKRPQLVVILYITCLIYTNFIKGWPILSKKELSRLVSLLPPIYIAIVNKKQILANLDNLFIYQKHKFEQGDYTSSISLISGPSRSADIQSELITGVHGPGNVHMLLID